MQSVWRTTVHLRRQAGQLPPWTAPLALALIVTALARDFGSTNGPSLPAVNFC